MIRFFTLVTLLILSVSAQAEFQINKIAKVGGIVWGMTFVDDSQILFTRRDGTGGIVDINTGRATEISGWPSVLEEGQGGLFDVKTAPDYQPGGWIYITYSKEVDGSGATTLARAKLQGNQLVRWQDLLVTDSSTGTGYHFGGRIAFDGAGHVFFGVGDRGERPQAQALNNHIGTLMRLNLDGSVPADNPFAGQSGKRPEIWSYGHRNPQGLAWDSEHNRLWEMEHGPRGGDEINLIRKGANYGWPVISYGKEYWGPVAVGEGTHRDGMEQPVKYYVPSIAPGSLMVYSGRAFPEWTGALMSGALKLRHINIVTVDESGKAVSEQRILEDQGERIRSLTQDKQGFIYFATDSGQIFQLRP